eukprot:6642694-Lingulodinium_polyedra.AAC.1
MSLVERALGCQPSGGPGPGSQRQKSAPDPSRGMECWRATMGPPTPRTPGLAATASHAARH